MQVTNIFGKEFTTIATMRAFAIEQGMSTKGLKLKADWIAALETFMEVQSEVLAAAVDAKNAALEIAVEAESATVIVQDSIEEIVVHVATAATSPMAIAAYRTALKTVIMAVVFALFVVGRTGLWCWENRSKAAASHWIADAANSRSGWKMRIQALNVLIVWDLAIGDFREAIGQKVAAAGSAMGLNSAEMDPQL